MTEAAAILIEHVRRWRGDRSPAAGPIVVGICGAQGSGKSTIAAEAAASLSANGMPCVVLALDDLYLPKAERHALAAEVHPLLATRGPPGTHDVALGLAILERLRRGEPTPIPRLDKLADDREPEGRWPVEVGPFDVVILEGWCVGAAPQPPAALAEPVNALERDEDPEGVWRRFVNTALEGHYRTLFAQLDELVLLQAPGFEVVARWRLQQEEANARAADPARRARAMDAAGIARFIQHYERLTRWMLVEMPNRVDLAIALDDERRVTAVRDRAG